MYGVPNTGMPQGAPPQPPGVPPPPPGQNNDMMYNNASNVMSANPNQSAPTPGSYAARSQAAYASDANNNMNMNTNNNQANAYPYQQNQNRPDMQQQQYDYGYQQQPQNMSANTMNPDPSQQQPMQQQQSQMSIPPNMPNYPPQQPALQQPIQMPQNQFQVPQQQVQQQQYPQQPYSQPSPYTPQPQLDSEQVLLQQATRRMQESTHIMRGAMEANDLSTTLDRAAAMLGELGDPKHHHHHRHHHGHHNHEPKAVMSPKHYYELHMMALDELPNLEEFFLSITAPSSEGCNIPRVKFTMEEIYQAVQFCPRAVPRLYLQICAGSALIRSTTMEQDDDANAQIKKNMTVKSVLKDLRDNVKCVQCPIRGLFLRHYLLQAMKDKLPDDGEEIGQDVNQQADNIEAMSANNNNDSKEVIGTTVDDTNFTNESSIAQTKRSNAVDDLMGGLGVDSNNMQGGFMDEPIISAPAAAPPAVPDMAPVQESSPNSIALVDAVEQDDPNAPGTVKDSYEFVLANFIEMNKLWVRIQHLPGDSKTKETKRKRERERNELRMMVGTNLVVLSQLEGVTSAIYGTVILPKILDQIVACHDPLAQAYLMDCIVQVFPDEFHIQTLEVVLSVCPKLREKVNIKTILQSVMNRMANYYADELLLNDEEDTHGVKMSVMMDSYSMFDTCIQNVLNARGIKLTAREAIRLESALVDFTLKCYPGQINYIDNCLRVCASALRGEGQHGILAPDGVTMQPNPIPLDDRAINELERILSLPLEELSLGVLDLEHYSELLELLPWENRKQVATQLLEVLDESGATISTVAELDQLFSIITPLLRNSPINGGGVNISEKDKDLIAKVIHIIYNEDTDLHFEVLNAAKRNIVTCGGGAENLTPVFYASMNLLHRVRDVEFPEVGYEKDGKYNCSTQEESEDKQDPVDVTENKSTEGDPAVHNESKEDDLSYGEDKEEDDLSYGDVSDQAGDIVKKDSVEELADEIEQMITIDDNLAQKDEETNQDLVEEVEEKQDELQSNIQGDLFADSPLETQEQEKEEETVSPPTFDKQVTCRKIFLFIQNLVAGLKNLNVETCFILSTEAAAAADCCARVVISRGGTCDFSSIAYTFLSEAFLAYESGITDSKMQVSTISTMIARLLKKNDQCKMVMLCSHLFYTYDDVENSYKNSQRALECLQRSLKVADICVSSSPGDLQLFVDILDIYLYHFEKSNPIITDKYISGLIALINQHIGDIGLLNPAIVAAKDHFVHIVKYINEKRSRDVRFSSIACNITM
ncbi:hypothetical protein CTEN210_05207 [Chaetoceros tenuissimus]|uniref:Vacuolar protein sorting-associated protein 35 n=1 Tax=Chaetoceros tenuissimus TaxID=426638 RepID=A0AAD3CMM9_9STRA|nr:hypothetical protein CTEN210_05207 [Chaetoceros tenuissimus]